MSGKNRTGSSGDGVSDLTDAASALEDELRRYDELAAELGRVPLNSEKNLTRAARALTEAADSQTRASTNVAALVAAITAARDHQQETAATLLARAQEIQRRVGTLEELLAVFGELGREAKSINEELQGIVALRATDSGVGEEGDGRAASAAINAEAAARLAPLDERMERAVQRAKELVDQANEEDIVDVAQRADGLRQQLQSARNKMKLFGQSLIKVATA